MIRIVWVTCRALLSHYVYHKSQAAFLLLGLILGVALWSAVQIINGHAKASYAQADQLLGAQANDWIRAKNGTISLESYVQLRRAGWRQIYPIIEKRLSTVDGIPLNLIATDLMALPSQQTHTQQAHKENTFDFKLWQSLYTPPYAVLVPNDLAERLNIKNGDSIQLRDGRSLPPAIIGTYTQQGQRLFMDIGAAAITLESPNPNYLVASQLETPQRQELDAWLQQNNPSLYRIENQQPLNLTQLTQSLHIHLSAMSLLAFAVGLFIVFNAVRFSLYTRRKTFSILRELGVEDKHIIIAIVTEAIILSLIGSVLGLILGYGLAQILLPSVASTLQNLYGAVLSQSIILSNKTVLGAWILTIAGLALALITPLVQQARQTSRQANNVQNNWIKETQQQKRLALIATVGLIIAAVSYPWLNTLLHGFVLLAMLLFSGAMILPYVIQACLKIFKAQSYRSNDKLSHWQWSDGLAQMIPMRTAFMAMLLALTANFGVDSLVNSFKTALTQWLEQRISADVYIQSDTDIDSEYVMTLPWVHDLHQRNGLSIRWPDKSPRPTLIRGLDPTAPDVKALPMSETLYPTNNKIGAKWPDTLERPSILANQQVKYLAGYKLGDIVSLDVPGDDNKEFIIAGFYYDYGNPYFQFYLPYLVVESTWSTAQPRGTAVWLIQAAHDEQEEWQQGLATLGIKPEDWIDRRDILNISIKIFDRTFAMTAAINTLTFFVAGIALLLSLLALHEKRLASYAHWRSMGLNWREWLSIVGKPLLLALVITWLLSIPLGTALAWLLIHDINVLSFGWTMALEWQWQPALWLGMLCIFVSLSAFIIAAIRVKYKLPVALKKLGQYQ